MRDLKTANIRLDGDSIAGESSQLLVWRLLRKQWTFYAPNGLNAPDCLHALLSGAQTLQRLRRGN